MNDNRANQIAALLVQAGDAHHVYERDVLNGVYHADWFAWYAEYVVEHGINNLLLTPVTVQEMTGLFFRVTEQFRDSGSPEHWSRFYARALCAPSQ